MDASSERDLCMLIKSMHPEQIDRYMDDEYLRDSLLEHIAYCVAPSCKNVCEARAARTAKRRVLEEASLSKAERWRRTLAINERRYILKELGIIK
jgi:hypothetical protein